MSNTLGDVRLWVVCNSNHTHTTAHGANEVIAHNFERMQHPRMRAWLQGEGREPSNAAIGIVSTAPAVAIHRRIDSEGGVSVADVCQAIAALQKALQRAQARSVREDRQACAA